MSSAERIRVVHPLFQAEGGGSIPTSALQLHLGWTTVKLAIELNRLWHSRLPTFTNPPEQCKAICAEYDGIFYAASIWSWPSARLLAYPEYYELKRLAIASDAPKNTASRMLRIMRRMICRDMPQIEKLISYQDTEVHTGTIYKAAGWSLVRLSSAEEWTRPSRKRRTAQSASSKARWQTCVRTVSS
jgi:hypothetical protein